jgi:hypothetical protein
VCTEELVLALLHGTLASEQWGGSA